jgi:hypothetical protein
MHALPFPPEALKTPGPTVEIENNGAKNPRAFSTTGRTA